MKNNWVDISESNNHKAQDERLHDGISHYDAWDMDEYLLHILSTGLKYLANGISFPGNEKFPTPNSWKEALLKYSHIFQEVLESDSYSDDEIKKRQALLEEGMNFLKDNFFDLWD